MNRGASISAVLTSFVCCFLIIFGYARDLSAANRPAVEDFVTRFYTLCLDREPDSVELNGWVSALMDGSQTGSDVAHGFVFSQEFINKNTTNEEYLTVLYRACFNRNPDQIGWNGWLSELNGGTSREDVLNAFILGTEFSQLCDEYGIIAFKPPGDPRKLVEDFVTRFYKLCLGRDPDTAGLNGWTTALLDGSQTGSDVAYGFVFSQEFINKNTTNEEYLTVLYEAFFNRQPDSAGWRGWMDALNSGSSREHVLNGFIFATEFAQLCDEYNILPYDPLNGDDDVGKNGILNIMTVNLLFSEIENRDDRLDAIAQYAINRDIHVILLQEVVGGLLVGTQNSAEDLQKTLGGYGKNYNLKTAFETGLPGLLAVANTILSRYEIEFSVIQPLSQSSEIEFDGLVIRLPRNVQMARLKVPGRGGISVYNTHWCAGCPPEELEVHWQESFEFLNNLESSLPGESPILFGGDLNLDRFRTEIERELYDLIVDDHEQGFSDAYADIVIAKSGGSESLETLCEDKDKADEHCTADVTLFSTSGSRRIDYLFTRNLGEVLDAEVVFNPFGTDPPDLTKPSVSDHAAVVISVKLQ